MPIFEYKCKKCGETIEVLVKSSKEKLSLKCTKCGSENLEKLMSAPSFNIKGDQKFNTATRCGNASPCCGADVPCDKPSCDN